MQMPEKINTMIARVNDEIAKTGLLNQVREKIITAVCRTTGGIEWTSYKIKQEETECIQQESVAIPFSGETAEEVIASLNIPDEVLEQIKGDITVPLRTAELLMRVVDLPATEEEEITDMVGFQIDKISPFPIDQIAISHEVLKQSDGHSTVLLATAKRSCIDSIGDTFADQGIHIHSIDSRLLGWMKLLKDENHLSDTGCEILIVDDGVDFSLVIIDDGYPVAFRMLHAHCDTEHIVDELIHEIEYTFTAIDAERDIPKPSSIQFWSYESPSLELQKALAERSGIKINGHELDTLPPLSEGIVRRALAGESRVELIPQEWIEHEKRKQLKKQSILSGSIVLGIWFIILLGFIITYKVRDIQYSRITKRAEALEPGAKQALENRKKLFALKEYTDRSESSLECLREVTQLMPAGDIEFLSYKYDKGKGISVRGSAIDDDMVDDFFIKLAKSTLFEELSNQSSGKKVSKGVTREIFSVSLVLPAKENN
jgi:hypothetical protein